MLPVDQLEHRFLGGILRIVEADDRAEKVAASLVFSDQIVEKRIPLELVPRILALVRRYLVDDSTVRAEQFVERGIVDGLDHTRTPGGNR